MALEPHESVTKGLDFGIEGLDFGIEVSTPIRVLWALFRVPG